MQTHTSKTRTRTRPYFIPHKHLYRSCHSCSVNRHHFHLSHLSTAGCSLQQRWRERRTHNSNRPPARVVCLSLADCDIPDDGHFRLDLITVHTLREMSSVCLVANGEGNVTFMRQQGPAWREGAGRACVCACVCLHQ